MIFFDPELNRIVATVVYDGPASAGKTTNVRALASHFSRIRRTEVSSPGETDGETLAFDRLCLDGGWAEGRRVMLQILSAPGHENLAAVREHLVRMADVAVFVCDSSRERMRWVVERYKRFRQGYGSHVRGCVVQANKQDTDDAMPADEVASLLRVGDTAVVSAEALNGRGVLETARLTFAMATELAREEIRAHGLSGIEGRLPTTDELLARIPSRTRRRTAPLMPAVGRTEGEGPSSERGLNRWRLPPRSVKAVAPPPLPTPDLDADLRWPPDEAESVVARLVGHPLRTVPGEPWEPIEAMSYVCDGVRLTGIVVDREVDLAQAVRKAGEEQRALGPIAMPGLVIAAVPDPEQPVIWRIHPEYPRLDDALGFCEDRAGMVGAWLSVVKGSSSGPLASQVTVNLKLDQFVFAGDAGIAYAGFQHEGMVTRSARDAVLELLGRPWPKDETEPVRHAVAQFAASSDDPELRASVQEALGGSSSASDAAE
ncbi:MAG: hypothetical protein AAGA56_16840 [Myxococcota bacterium]